MHVLFVIDTWGLIGGTERHAQVVVPALLERGHRVTVLCRDDQQPGFADVEVIELEALEGTTLPRWAKHQLADAVRGRDIDVVFHSALRNVDAVEVLTDLFPLVRYVHDHTLFCPGLNKYREDGETCRDAMGAICMQRYWNEGGCICFKRAGHGEPIVEPLTQIRERWRELDIVQRATRVLTNSHYMRRELLGVGCHPDKTSVLYYFTQSNTDAQPPEPLAPEVEAFLAGSDAPLVFTPARLTLPDKGVDFLLTALSKVESPLRCVIAGSGPAEDWLRQKAVDEGVAERVHFSGWTSSGAMETLYSRADVVVCPSVWDEPFGLVGIESMVHEKPVVAFRVGGIPEWLEDGETGMILERKDTDAMAASIDRLLADAQLRSTMGAAGRQKVERDFPRDGHVERLESFLLAAAGA